jgi:hypothetical protein
MMNDELLMPQKSGLSTLPYHAVFSRIRTKRVDRQSSVAFIAAAAHQREILGTYNQGTLSDVNDTLPYPS